MVYVVLLVLGACSWDVGLKGDDEGLGDPMVISCNVGLKGDDEGEASTSVARARQRAQPRAHGPGPTGPRARRPTGPRAHGRPRAHGPTELMPRT